MTVLDLKNLIFELPDDMEVFVVDDSGDNINLTYTDLDCTGVIELKGVIREKVFAIATLTEEDNSNELLN